MKLFIKNIADLSSLATARVELDNVGLGRVAIDMKKVDTGEKLTATQYELLYVVLKRCGIELYRDKKDFLVQQIKECVIEVVYNWKAPPVPNLSTHLNELLKHDYTYMSNLFSQHERTTIEKFYIGQKIEMVKELLVYEQMNATTIAAKMHYSSLAHLSGQFKKITGLTISEFKQQCGNGELPPENH